MLSLSGISAVLHNFRFHFLILAIVLVALLILQISWTYGWTITYNTKIERILANQLRIIEQYNAIAEYDRIRITQNKEMKAALDNLAKNDNEIVDKCVKMLEDHVNKH